MLPDLLTQQLILVFRGTAAGNMSAALKQYYAKPGNKFWPTLYQVGLTPNLLRPTEYERLLEYQIGLTDLVKNSSGMDTVLERKDFDIDGLTDKIIRFQPDYLCFNGKRAGQTYLKQKVAYGLQPEKIGQTRLFVASSTSGAANRWWNIVLWKELFQLYQQAQTKRGGN